MKARPVLAAIIMALAAALISAQDAKAPSGANPTAAPGGAESARAESARAAVNTAAGPGEPEIVMPQVILQIEDLSVEKVEAQLPPEEDLLPPDRAIPVVSEGDLAVGEPLIPASAAEGDEGGARPSDRLLSSDVRLGAGSQNMISGSMSLKTLGMDPRFSLEFQHETLDGFSGHDAGSGYSLRNDGLRGGLKFLLGGIDVDLAGGFSENEHGLQSGALSYTAVLNRSLSADASLLATPLDWLTVDVDVTGGYDSLTLEGTTPVSLTGLRVSPDLSATARLGWFTAGLDARYWYSTASAPAGDLHRFQGGVRLGANLPATFVLEGTAAWFWNSAGLSLFPFSLSVTGTPADFLTLSLEGGYRVVPYDVSDIIAAHAYVYPDTGSSLEDDRGWYADSTVRLTLTPDLAATVKVSFMDCAAMPVAGTAVDAATGLFVVSQSPAPRLSTDLGLRWGISSSFSLSAAWTQEYLASLPFFTPRYAFTAGVIGLAPSGRFGGSLSAEAAPTLSGLLQLPIVRLSVFWKASDSVKLQLDCDDILWPLLDGPRWDVAPDTYVTPGFRIAGSLGMSL
jgi:hypothetical protein